jgi:hypothetical protein
LFTHHQIVVSITICTPEWSDIKYTWMPCVFHQNTVNLVMYLSIGWCPSKITSVTMREHCTFEDKIFGFGKVYYSNSNCNSSIILL